MIKLLKCLICHKKIFSSFQFIHYIKRTDLNTVFWILGRWGPENHNKIYIIHVSIFEFGVQVSPLSLPALCSLCLLHFSSHLIPDSLLLSLLSSSFLVMLSFLLIRIWKIYMHYYIKILKMHQMWGQWLLEKSLLCEEVPIPFSLVLLSEFPVVFSSVP